MTAALAGHRFTADLERVQGAIVEFRARTTGRSPVVRRPLHRMVEELAAFAEPGR